MKNLSQLKWQCRRGVKELDLVLGTYLREHYEQADDSEKASFVNLLQMEDPLLFDLLLGNIASTNKNQAILIKKLREIVTTQHNQ